MERTRNFNMNMILCFGFTLIFSLAFLRVHMRIQTTLIGYNLGKLKAQEASLLEERSHLQMTLAQLTTKNHLSLMANSPDKKISLTKVAINP
jgi:hypothetical protein